MHCLSSSKIGRPAVDFTRSMALTTSLFSGSIKAPAVEEAEFPSLGAAVTIKETKKKKKQTMSLGEFVAAAPSRRRGDDAIQLPTAPRSRIEGTDDVALPTGPSSRFGGDRGGGRLGGEGRRPSRRFGADTGAEEDAGPSRADMVEDWGATRKFVPSDATGGGSGRSHGGGSRGGGSFRRRDDSRDREGPSRADLVDDWGVRRQFTASSPRRGGRGFGGFDDGGSRRVRDGDSSYREPSRADLEDKWERRGDHKPIGFDDRPRRMMEDEGRRGFADAWRRSRDRSRDERVGDRSRDVSQEVTWRRDTPPPEAEDRDVPKERPKLVLKPRTVPEETIAAKVSDDSKRSSVFGAARPREEVLKEQGRDPVKEDIMLEQHSKAPPPSSGKSLEETVGEEQSRLQKRLEEMKTRADNPAVDEEEKTKIQQDVGDLEAKLEQFELANKGENGFHDDGREWQRQSSRRDERSLSRPRERRAPPASRRDTGERW